MKIPKKRLDTSSIGSFKYEKDAMDNHISSEGLATSGMS